MTDESPTILLTDDARANRTFMKQCLAREGYQFLEARDGQEALDKIHTHRVDLVILDLMMPTMDGFVFLEKLKVSPPYDTIPVIVNSSLEDTDSIRRALSLGSYDYFIKSLPSEQLKFVLPLKVRNAIQAKLLLQESHDRKAMLEREILAAGKYQRFLLPKNFIAKGLEIAPFFHPHIGVGGDFFDFVPLAGEKTAFIIADVSGHGVLSAMIATILKPLFGQYMRETESPLHTFTRLNQNLLTLTDSTDYISAFTAVYDPVRQTLCYANAGHPPPLHFRHDTGVIAALEATGVFLGLFEDEEWLAGENTISVAPHDRLLLITDGVSDARPEAGTCLGMRGLQRAFQGMSHADFKEIPDRLWRYLQDYTGNRLSDDVTFVALEFRDLSLPHILHVPNDPSRVLPVVEEVLRPMSDLCSPRDQAAIKIGLVEILLNAIEHGNLAIGYEHKREALEAGTFDELVETRRRLEPYASRKVTITYTVESTQATFTIRDEGNGFDWRTLPDPRDEDRIMLAHGRGILVARSNMDACTFHPPGNAVTLVKDFSP